MYDFMCTKIKGKKSRCSFDCSVDNSRQTINSCTMKLKSIFTLRNVEKILSLKGEVLKGVIIENTS